MKPFIRLAALPVGRPISSIEIPGLKKKIDSGSHQNNQKGTFVGNSLGKEIK
jgi:hypothetical protein